MDPITIGLIAGGIGALGGLFRGTQKPPQATKKTWTEFRPEEQQRIAETLGRLQTRVGALEAPTLATDFMRFRPTGELSPYGRQLLAQARGTLAEQAAQSGRQLQRQLSNVSPALANVLAAQAQQQARLAGAALPFQALQTQKAQDIQEAQLAAQLQALSNEALLRQLTARTLPIQALQDLLAAQANIAQMYGIRHGEGTQPQPDLISSVLGGFRGGLGLAGQLAGLAQL